MQRLSALVPAAGLSSRMQGFKPLLPLGGESVLGRVVGALRAAGVEDVVVVAGHRGGETAAEAARLGVKSVHNPEYRQGMFSSVKAGMSALDPACEAFFVLPVDVPLVRPASLRRLIGAKGGRDLVYPVFGGTRGHPPLVSGALRAELAAHPGEGGLRAALEDACAAGRSVLEVEVPDANVLFDMDTPKDYQRAQGRLRRLGYPNREEAGELLRLRQVPPKGLAHARAVARVALAMGLALNAAPERRKHGALLDLDLVESCAMLHDIAKGEPGHEAAGGRLLFSAGFPQAAGIVAAHRDIDLGPDDPLTEREIVFLADKLVSCDRLVSVERRFQEKLDLFGADPQAALAIEGRRRRALGVLARVEAEAGCAVGTLCSAARLGS